MRSVPSARCLIFVLTVSCAASASAQTTPLAPQPKLEILTRQGDYYWVVETAPDGSRRGGWVNAQVPLDRIDRNALTPIPALPAPVTNSPVQGPPEAASLDERVARIERALAAGQNAADAANLQEASVRSTPLPQVTQPPKLLNVCYGPLVERVA